MLCSLMLCHSVFPSYTLALSPALHLPNQMHLKWLLPSFRLSLPRQVGPCESVNGHSSLALPGNGGEWINWTPHALLLYPPSRGELKFPCYPPPGLPSSLFP